MDCVGRRFLEFAQFGASVFGERQTTVRYTDDEAMDVGTCKCARFYGGYNSWSQGLQGIALRVV